MEDERIVDLYWIRSETAISETQKKYGKYCHYIAYQILENNDDADEVENDTYMKAWNSIPPHHPDSLKSYLGMLCRRTALDRYDQKNYQKRGGGHVHLLLDELQECIPDNRNNKDLTDQILFRDILNNFLRKLPKKTRNIFVRRYWYMSSIAEIATEYSMGESNVKMVLLRTRNKLKKYLEKEGYNL